MVGVLVSLAFAGAPLAGTTTGAASVDKLAGDGVLTVEGDNAIVGGDLADQGDWPDVAGIAFRGRSDIGCTGTLIAPTVVITAGHCVDGITGVRLDAADYLDSGEGEYIRAKKVVEYPNSQRSYDVSVVVLDTPAKTKPRPVALGCVVDRYLVDGAEATIAGYGAHDQRGTRYDSSLRWADITINDADCSELSDGCQRAVSPGGELSAGGDGVDTCYGDSGGPLYLHTPQGDYLAGVTSRAYSWVSVPCRDGGIYVRPDAIIDWIEDESGVDIPEPECNSAPEPTAEALVIAEDRDGVTQVLPNDPDDAQQHTFVVAAPPAHGEAIVAADGTLTVTPARDFVGDDAVTVTVTDNGDPSLSADLVVPVRVLTHKDYKAETGLSPGCGCAGVGVSPGWLAAVAGLALMRRRRGVH